MAYFGSILADYAVFSHRTVQLAIIVRKLITALASPRKHRRFLREILLSFDSVKDDLELVANTGTELTEPGCRDQLSLSDDLTQ